eukprot:7964346-Alexandrium_andersonii.AAC.1
MEPGSTTSVGMLRGLILFASGIWCSFGGARRTRRENTSCSKPSGTHVSGAGSFVVCRRFRTSSRPSARRDMARTVGFPCQAQKIRKGPYMLEGSSENNSSSEARQPRSQSEAKASVEGFFGDLFSSK